MSQDHYVARTYLKHFGDPAKKGMLNAYSKQNGKEFPCWPADVCREWDGDLNSKWLQDPALLGQFRKIFEPLWNPALDNLRAGTVSPADKLAISGYFSQLLTCTPAWRRVMADTVDNDAKRYFSFRKEMKVKHGGDPDLRVEDVEALERGEIEIEHDQDWVKAVITRQLMNFAWAFYHQDWVILENQTNNPFITSDNPVALLRTSRLIDPAVRLLPITPTLCLQIQASREAIPPFNPTLPPEGQIEHRKITPGYARFVNRLQAQCAEEVVFSSIESEGLTKLVTRAAPYCVKNQYQEFESDESDTIYQANHVVIGRK